ncbi:MAG TPA: sulfatase-like hydrolase/transferase [Candidatus Polarisedimenticolia bacterium]|nr:sulfatase-like hydrolase/transferase [Candidatus Polarisedimenticolia bacterium]
MSAAARRARAVWMLGYLALFAVAALFGALAWRLTPLEGSTLKRVRRGAGHGAIPEEPSLVLISVDGLRIGRLGSYGDAPLSPTPHLDRLAAEGFRFEQATTPVPETLPAHLSMMTGASPVGRPWLLRPGAALPPDAATLAEVLHGAGYQTAAFVGAAAVGRATGLARGFDRFDEPRVGDRPATIRWLAERPAADVVDAARAWLDDHFRSRFYLWVQLSDPTPPHPADPPRTLRHRDPYDAELERTDAEIGRLLQRLASLGVAGTTIVVVAGSHGEGLGEHAERGSGFGLYDATLRVPLLLRVPGLVVRDRSIPEPVRLFDLAPTLLDLLRLAAPRPMEGTSLVPLLDPEGRMPPLPARAEAVAFPNYLGDRSRVAIRGGGFKLIHGDTLELYDLKRDPGEARNLASVQQDRVVEIGRQWPEAFGSGTGTFDADALLSGPPIPSPPGASALVTDALTALRAREGPKAWRALEDLRSLRQRSGERSTPPGLLAISGGTLRLLGETRQALDLYEAALRQLTTPRAVAAADPAATALTPGAPPGAGDPAKDSAHPARAVQAAAAPGGAPGSEAGAAPGHEDPLRALVLAEIGACRRVLGDRDGAIEAYRAAAAARLDDVDGRLALAETLLEAGAVDEAIDELRAALSRAPGEPELLAGLGRAQVAAGQAEAGMRALQDAIRAAPWLHRPWLDLGGAYEALGRVDEARRAYQDVQARTDPDDPLHREAAERERALRSRS